jgi:hypothetical protein
MTSKPLWPRFEPHYNMERLPSQKILSSAKTLSIEFPEANSHLAMSGLSRFSRRHEAIKIVP